MRLQTGSAATEKKRHQLWIIWVGIGALLLLIAGIVPATFLHYVVPASASSVVGVYVGAGDGQLYKLNGDQGTLAWRIQLTDRNLPAAPAIANGVAYFGARDGNVYAVSAGTGHQLWHYQTGGSILSTPTVAGQVVYVSSTDDNIYALNAQNGGLIWRFNAGGGREAVVPGNVVVVNGVAYSSSSDQADHSYLFALDTKTDTQLWRVKVANQLLGNLQFANNVLYLTSTSLAHAGKPQAVSSSLSAYDAQTGHQLWTAKKIGPLTFAAPLVANGIVYVGSQDNAVYAFDAQAGTQVWRHVLSGPIYQTPLIDNGTLVVGVGQVSSTSIQTRSATTDSTAAGSAIVALDARTGNLTWQQTQISQYNGTSLALYGTRIYLGASDNQVYALDVTTGAISWHYQMESANPLTNAPITAAQ